MKTGHEILEPFSLPDDMREQIAKEINSALKERRRTGRMEAFRMMESTVQMYFGIEKRKGDHEF